MPDLTTNCNELIDAAGAAVPEIAPEPVLAEAETNRPPLLDIRPAGEREAEGAIPGSPWALLDRLVHDAEDALAEAGLEDPEAVVICYCRRGNRSKTAVELLRAVGYNRALSLSGGIHGWAAAGGELVTGPDARP